MKQGVTATKDAEKTIENLVSVNVLFCFSFVLNRVWFGCALHDPGGEVGRGRLGGGGGGFIGRPPEGLWTWGLTLAVNT